MIHHRLVWNVQLLQLLLLWTHLSQGCIGPYTRREMGKRLGTKAKAWASGRQSRNLNGDEVSEKPNNDNNKNNETSRRTCLEKYPKDPLGFQGGDFAYEGDYSGEGEGEVDSACHRQLF